MTNNFAPDRRRRRRLGGADGRAPDVDADRPQPGHQPAPRHVRRHDAGASTPTAMLRVRRRARRRTPRAPTTTPAARTPSRRPPPTWRSRACSARTPRSASTRSSLAPMPVIAHCISVDNSFFSPDDGALHMGDGGVDDAEDSDVTVHEFGHATQAAQVPGWGPGSDTEQRAMGEGFGDFLAAYIYLQDGNPTYQAARRFCVAEWDAVSYNAFSGPDDGSGCLRWVDGTARTRARHRHLRRHADRGAQRRPLLVGDADLRVQRPRAADRHGAGPQPTCSRWCSRTTSTSPRRRATPRSPTRSPHCAPRTTRSSMARTSRSSTTCGQQRLGKTRRPTPRRLSSTGCSRWPPPTRQRRYRTVPSVDVGACDPRARHASRTAARDVTDPAKTAEQTITRTAMSAGGNTSKPFALHAP